MDSQITNWDLTELFSSADDTRINQTIKQSIKLANEFESSYRGKIIGLSAEGLLECLQSIETFEAKLSDVTLYSNLAFSADMTNSKTQALHDKVEN